ncbi:hypothetical protein EOA60_20795 [Mesorhizobium sp. M1A.F.Ca.IN.020.06.1.1]|uniref:hypothetical protein n=1 Tax=unclassified Mesorhizobium TaxID=325217 RepID=UPI000FC9C7F9|nr:MULTISPECIES: hypothetical protein [unclassified Mesorhizobium]RUV86931.1 hypothetical protein EOA51_13125 [Mesorhizobium sp. M1A.F.Ca.IN.020.32.1.1]RUW10567.1 hypothetical protein EOA46_14900 [Mesorhizobium sp. M1A.F.Ca.IN.022.05.2.1]RUW24445.1 hypothetical protein EOA60_20795 [Mesorhizobium sp. M1A.F.Ca.IN.020.06.1.1]RWF81648.1 MAG: hypothetical protein EOQ35_13230 [Mesorhizobium sp.]RWG91785.1 MAG: hypothetical protein EOQ68_05785 [Mesorhizobium sp.]
MKGKAKRAGGGVVAKDPSPKEVYAGGGSNVAKEADERKDGGRVKKKEGGKVGGKMSKMRLDRPGRKSGGRVGADRSPLSEAAKTTGPSAKEGD